MLKKIFFTVLILSFYCITIFARAPLPADKAFQFSGTARDNQTVLLSWKIAPGFYLYRDRFTFDAVKSPNTTLGKPLYPSNTLSLKTATGIEPVYANHLTIPVPLAQSNAAHVILRVQYQGCAKDGYCYPPITKVVPINLAGNYLEPVSGLDIDIPLTSIKNPTPKTENTFLFLLSFLGFGVLLSLTPCVLPMIPILFSMITKHEKSHLHAFLVSLSYVIGMSLMYAIAGILFGIIGKNVQMIFQKPSVIIAFSFLFVLMALSEFGLFNIQLPERWRSKIDRVSHHQKRGTLIGAFIMGILSTLILSPCVTPPLVAALSLISQTGNATLGGTALFIMGIGMGAPLLLIGIAGPKVLPKSGKWMTAIKYFTGVLLLAVAIIMIQKVLPNDKPQTDNKLHFQLVHNITEVETALKNAAPAHQTVILDFYADWCSVCKEMDSTTLKDPAIIAHLSSYVLLRANVTNDTDDDQLMMQHYRIIGTPTFVFFKNNQEIPNTRIVGYISVKQLTKELKQVDNVP